MLAIEATLVLAANFPAFCKKQETTLKVAGQLTIEAQVQKKINKQIKSYSEL